MHGNIQMANPIIYSYQKNLPKSFSHIAELHQGDIHPTSAAISMWYKNGITQVWQCKMIYPTSNGRCRNSIAKRAERHEIDINATSFGPASQCRYRTLLRLFIHVGFSDLEADICPPSCCRRRFSKLIPSFTISVFRRSRYQNNKMAFSSRIYKYKYRYLSDV